MMISHLVRTAGANVAIVALERALSQVEFTDEQLRWLRAVLDRDWDPIGVADIVDDEYDMYIGQLHSLITAGASKQDIADRLLSIEIDRMGLTGTPMNQLLRVAQRLQDLDLPEVDHQQPD